MHMKKLRELNVNDKSHRNRRLGHAAARCGVAETLLDGARTYNTGSNKRKVKSEEPRSEPPAPESHPSPHTDTPSSSQPSSSSGVESSVPYAPSTSQIPISSSSQPHTTTESCPNFSTPGSSTSIPDTATLLAVLALIDDAGGPAKMEGNTQFQEALKGLLAQLSATPQPPPNNHMTEDDEVVALDKENVNPDAFRKRARLLEVEKSTEFIASSSRSSTHKIPDRPVQGLGPSGRSNTMPSDNSNNRSFSNGIDENRSALSRKGKEKAKDTIYHSIFANSSSAVPWSSPPRSRNDHAAIGSSRRMPIVIPDSPCTPKARRVPASSPIRESKQYVVPEWARTTTATQPKFSDEYKKAMEEVARRREEGRKANRRKWGSARSKSTPSLSSQTEMSTTNTDSCEKPQTSPSLTTTLPVMAASSEPTLLLPVCAASGSLPFICPKTPPRKRPRSPSQSPLTRSSSLFTPKDTSLVGDRNSPLFSPSHRARKLIRSDPVSPCGSLEKPNFRNGENNDDDALTLELDSALDGIGSSASLLVVLSDADTERSPGEGISSDNEEEAIYPRKQYWPGLPPSSPPQSSPRHEDNADLPSVDTPIGEEDPQLPIVSSDVEEDMMSPSDDHDRTHINSDALDAGLDINAEQSASTVENEDIFSLFTNLNSATSDPLNYDWNMQGDTGTNMGLEDMDFTQFWESVKPLLGDLQPSIATCSNDVDMNGGLDVGNLGLDGTLPLLDNSSLSGTDHSKLAEDLRTLYSGCVM
ncbi:hypothetical protein E1B28_010046 [Marasmius oreades]|uniref:Uncharacterized protein n=1 Tax=Marasmius oreades TaxID=181124 RepID=A0A9P7UT92_9AGAR|nr:uncharacterized protein E1B28_010046 [Marasmius oreades]KAG7090979.1 hypothetical protein E1B28_010046 [Marasmius oreades]